jgi:hypothetical protein
MSGPTLAAWCAVGHWVECEDDTQADICNCDPASMGQEHLGRSDAETCANARLIAQVLPMVDLLDRLGSYLAEGGDTAAMHEAFMMEIHELTTIAMSRDLA